jgi:hypothetical protein
METIVKLLKMLLPTEWVKWLDGYKSIIGLIGCIAYGVLKYFQVPVPDEVFVVFSGILGIGIVHKGQKVEEAMKALNAALEEAKKPE